MKNLNSFAMILSSGLLLTASLAAQAAEYASVNDKNVYSHAWFRCSDMKGKNLNLRHFLPSGSYEHLDLSLSDSQVLAIDGRSLIVIDKANPSAATTIGTISGDPQQTRTLICRDRSTFGIEFRWDQDTQVKAARDLGSCKPSLLMGPVLPIPGLEWFKEVKSAKLSVVDYRGNHATLIGSGSINTTSMLACMKSK